MIILGAGLAGCMAGVLNKDATLYEPRGDMTHHQAVLRFRTPDVGIEVGIPFTKVKVYKGIWSEGEFVTPNIRHMNDYSRKVTMGGFYDRSIANTETEYRWIAPIDFHERLKAMCSKIVYDVNLETIKPGILVGQEPIISTLPIGVLSKLLDGKIETRPNQEMIHVSKYQIPNADLQQTIYYPDYTDGIYRATMTGDIFRIESMFEIFDPSLAFDSFGIDINSATIMLENHIQPIGKLTPIHEGKRRDFIKYVTDVYRVYSLGRFANWRNILLDDVLQDIHQIKRMINQDQYQNSLERL